MTQGRGRKPTLDVYKPPPLRYAGEVRCKRKNPPSTCTSPHPLTGPNDAGKARENDSKLWLADSKLALAAP
jgi:hypothetical protein